MEGADEASFKGRGKILKLKFVKEKDAIPFCSKPTGFGRFAFKRREGETLSEDKGAEWRNVQNRFDMYAGRKVYLTDAEESRMTQTDELVERLSHNTKRTVVCNTLQMHRWIDWTTSKISIKKRMVVDIESDTNWSVVPIWKRRMHGQKNWGIPRQSVLPKQIQMPILMRR